MHQKKQIGHHARPRRASATVPLRTDQHRRIRGMAGAHRSPHPKKERCNKIQKPQLHVCMYDVPRGHTAQGSCRVEQERDNTSRGSNNGEMTDRKRRQ